MASGESTVALNLRRTGARVNVDPEGRIIASGPSYIHVAILMAAFVLWALSLSRIDLANVNDFGLISVLPIEYFAALVLIVIGFSWAILCWTGQPWLPYSYVFMFTVVIHAVSPIIYPAPKYSYVYKHIAVVRYIEEYGEVHRYIDIYQNWPGLFDACALFDAATGLDAASYANWAELFFMVCCLVGFRYILRGLTNNDNHIAVTLLLFSVGLWTAPIYLAPQSLGYFLAFMVVGLALRCLGPDPSAPAQQRLTALTNRMSDVVRRSRVWRVTLPVGADGPVPSTGLSSIRPDLPAFGAILVILMLAGAIVISHQLTPFFVLLSLTILVLARRCSAWWLPIAIAVMFVLQIVASYDYLSQHQSLISLDFFQNIQGAQSGSPSPGTAGHRFVALIARVVSAAILGLALLGWWRVERHERGAWLLLLALAPGLLVFVQGYGGEGIYRVYIFMLPWLSYLGSSLLLSIRRVRPVVAMPVFALVSAVGVLLFIVSHFGYERVSIMPPQEVAASEWFERNTPPGSVINFLSFNYPSPSTSQYARHFTGAEIWGVSVFSNVKFAGRRLDLTDVPDTIELIHSFSNPGSPSYLALGPSEAAFAESYGFAPVDSVNQFSDLLVRDPRFRMVFRNKDAIILEVLRGPPA
jgi:hypothetical protein